MLRTEMIDNLLDSYTMRELKALTTMLYSVDVDDDEWSDSDIASLSTAIHDILSDPGGWHEKFNKLAQMEQ